MKSKVLASKTAAKPNGLKFLIDFEHWLFRPAFIRNKIKSKVCKVVIQIQQNTNFETLKSFKDFDVDIN